MGSGCPSRHQPLTVYFSETGRIRFRGVQFQTPSSVSFFGLTEFRGANSVSSSQPVICVPKRTHRVFCRTHRVYPRTQRGSVSSLLRNSTLETVFRPFPNLNQKRKISPKTEVFGRTSLRTSGQKLRSGPPNPSKTSISARAYRADVHEKTSV